MEYQSTTVAETYEIAARIAKKIKGGEVLALSGDLGAGKTALAQGLARALGVAANVNSPTFVIMKVYEAAHPRIKKFVHIDAYRLRSEKELEAIGAPEYFSRPDTLVLIEWPENIIGLLPGRTIHIRLEIEGQSERNITIK